MNRGQISAPDGRIDEARVPTGLPFLLPLRGNPDVLPIRTEAQIQVRHWDARRRADQVIYKGPLDPFVIAKLAGPQALEDE